ncbi:MAG: zeta toxin family protein [Arcicella sp.]|nr:zeta toxin family protein [Arcicella sp.]
MPNLFVISGANGAGKSTLSKIILPEEFSNLEVFDGDKFFVESLMKIFPAQIKSPKYARDMAFQKTVSEFERLVEKNIISNSSFAYEGHFSSESPWQTIIRFREMDYHITMIFLMVSDLSLSLKRVSERVKTGGHYVTPQEIEKNFYGNLFQLNKHFQLIDELIIADNSTFGTPSQILRVSEGKITESIEKNIMPNWVKQYLYNLIQ